MHCDPLTTTLPPTWELCALCQQPGSWRGSISLDNDLRSRYQPSTSAVLGTDKFQCHTGHRAISVAYSANC